MSQSGGEKNTEMAAQADSDWSAQNSQGSPDKGLRKTIAVFCILLLICLLIGYIVFAPKETPLDKAVSMIKANRAASAVPLLEDLYKQNPAEVAVYPWLAQGYLATDRVAEGRTALDTAFRVQCRDESLASVVDNYSVYYQNRGHFEEAERLYQSALASVEADRLAASRARMYFKWAEADRASANLDGAITHLNAARKYAGYLEEPMKSQVPHLLADCYRQLAALAESRQDIPKAIELLEMSIKVADEPMTRITLAGLYNNQKDSAKAIENYQVVAHLDGNNLEVRHRLVELYLEKKDIEKAQLALTELVDKERSFENYELLASLNLKLQNYAGAVRALEEACALRPRPQLLKQLIATLNKWSLELAAQNKTQEAMSVKGHAERAAEQLEALLKEEKKDVKPEVARPDKWNPGNPPVAIVKSHNWLVKGSLTPEGEIKIKNITGEPVTDLSLTAVFYDNTKKRSNGTVVLPVASAGSAPFAADAERTLYFSCPNIVKEDHQLAVIILWKGKFLKEFPVSKQH